MTFNTFNSNKKYRSLVISCTALISPVIFASNCLAASNFNSNHTSVNSTATVNTHKNIIVASNSGHTQLLPGTINLVKQYEGFRSSAYIDTSGLPVIGYGQSKIYGKTVRMGQYVSKAQADAALAQELYHIQRIVQSKVRVRLTPNQLGALTSLVYNAGTRVITNSTLSRKLNSGDYAGAAREFPRWNKAHQGGRLVAMPGLTKRRLAEQRMFLNP